MWIREENIIGLVLKSKCFNVMDILPRPKGNFLVGKIIIMSARDGEWISPCELQNILKWLPGLSDLLWRVPWSRALSTPRWSDIRWGRNSVINLAQILSSKWENRYQSFTTVAQADNSFYVYPDFEIFFVKTIGLAWWSLFVFRFGSYFVKNTQP